MLSGRNLANNLHVLFCAKMCFVEKIENITTGKNAEVDVTYIPDVLYAAARAHTSKLERRQKQ